MNMEMKTGLSLEPVLARLTDVSTGNSSFLSCLSIAEISVSFDNLPASFCRHSLSEITPTLAGYLARGVKNYGLGRLWRALSNL